MNDTASPRPEDQEAAAAGEPVAEAITAEIVEEAAPMTEHAQFPNLPPTPTDTGSTLPPAATVPAQTLSTPTGAAGTAFQAAAEPTAPKKRGWLPAALAGLAIGAVVGGASGAGVAFIASQGSSTSNGSVNGPQTITVNDFDDTTYVGAVAAQAMASVVTISVTGSSATGQGSGVVIDDEGHIVTNAHVVTLEGAESSPQIKVTTSSGRVYTAEIVGIDALMDVAVIQVVGATELQPIEFADSSTLNVGDATVAIGAPLGLSGTVTSGIISSLDRSIEVASSATEDSTTDSATPSPTTPDDGDAEDPFDFFQFDVPGDSGSGSDQGDSGSGSSNLYTGSGLIQLVVIQTDTAINPGNSGGALLDAQGRLIGINVAIANSGSSTGSIGVGFAIPSNIVARIAAELVETGTATHGLLGASIADVADDPAQTDATVIGASVVELVSGGAAELAGLQVGDIVVSLDGVPVTGKTDLTALVRSHASGATVEVGYVREGQSGTLTATLGSLDAAIAAG